MPVCHARAPRLRRQLLQDLDPERGRARDGVEEAPLGVGACLRTAVSSKSCAGIEQLRRSCCGHRRIFSTDCRPGRSPRQKARSSFTDPRSAEENVSDFESCFRVALPPSPPSPPPVPPLPFPPLRPPQVGRARLLRALVRVEAAAPPWPHGPDVPRRRRRDGRAREGALAHAARVPAAAQPPPQARLRPLAEARRAAAEHAGERLPRVREGAGRLRADAEGPRRARRNQRRCVRPPGRRRRRAAAAARARGREREREREGGREGLREVATRRICRQRHAPQRSTSRGHQARATRQGSRQVPRARSLPHLPTTLPSSRSLARSLARAQSGGCPTTSART